MPTQPVRRQGAADRVDRERRPGDLPRAQAALQRPVRRPPRPAGRAVVEASAGRGARGLLHGAARIGAVFRPRPRPHGAGLRHDGVRHEAAAPETGVDAEIIDLRTLWPLDLDAIVDSVKKTGRCVIVHEATRTSGFGAELAALVQEHCFYHLEARQRLSRRPRGRQMGGRARPPQPRADAHRIRHLPRRRAFDLRTIPPPTGRRPSPTPGRSAIR